jgi:hypothetical protein
MDEAEADRAVLAETTVFLSYFKGMPDHRQPGKVIYPLDEILLLSLLAVLAGAETFTDIARFGEKKLALLRRFRPFANGTPAHDHLGDIFATLDAEAFRRCFVSWVAALIKAPAQVIAIDGKTLGSSPRAGSRAAPARRGTPRSRSIWSRPSPPGSDWSWGRSRSPKSPTRSSPFRCCST